jgi:hypothetical protein
MLYNAKSILYPWANLKYDKIVQDDFKKGKQNGYYDR